MIHFMIAHNKKTNLFYIVRENTKTKLSMLICGFNKIDDAVAAKNILSLAAEASGGIEFIKTS